jgi:hypothetical protein
MFMLLLVAVSSAYAQGTTAELVGAVTQTGQPLPGVTVTISSPSLQGTRTAITGAAGGYSFVALPPGEYTVSFQMEGMQRNVQRTTLSLAQTSRVDADLKLTAVTEAITVTASAPAVLETTQVTMNFTGKQIDRLPAGRTVRAITLLAPGVNANGVNAQITISGAPSYDNTFLVNGVVVNENLRGQPHSLFIEDAIQEMTVLTAGISAEYGRFTGGVVSTLTKSGGNEFSGSLRDSLTNPAWTKITPFRDARGNPQAKPLDKVDHVYEGTLGGYALRDRLWFFGAGRKAKTATQRSTAFTNLQFNNTIDEKRWEGKLTGQITPRHSLVASYLDIKLTEINNSFGAILDTESIVPSRQLPNSLRSIHYNGILTNNLLVEGQYAKKEFAFVNSGSRFTDRVKGTWISDLVRGTFFASPVFCGVCTPEGRNNKSWLGKGNYFISTKGLGNHGIIFGVEDFAETRIANNHQSGSDFTITNSGNIIQGSDVFPRFDQNTTLRWQPILKNSEGTDFKTQSAFVNDKWDFNEHWSFNAGLRYDKNKGHDADGHLVSDDSAFSPRLGATYDPLGNGRHRVNLAVARYVSKIADGNVGGSGQAAGNPGFISFRYGGPVINGPGTTNFVSKYDALAQLFAWFDSVGGTDNKSFLIGTSVPGFAARFDASIASPSVDEITVGYGTQLRSNAYAKVDLVSREWKNFYAGRLTTATGKATDPFGNVGDQSVTTNDDRETERTYRGVQLQGQWTPNRFIIGGGYTYSRLRGNDEGEGAGTATIRNLPNSMWYPEYLDYAGRRPSGWLGQDQRHRARLWASYDLPSPIGQFIFAALHNYDSGQSYSAVGTIDASGRITPFEGIPSNPGYTLSQLGTTHGYFFSKRGEFRLPNVQSTDVAVKYSLPITRLNLFLQARMSNIFNNSDLADSRFINANVITRRTGGAASGLVAFNPKTQTPVEGVHYRLDPNFGKASRFEAFQTPRSYNFSAGVRF